MSSLPSRSGYTDAPMCAQEKKILPDGTRNLRCPMNSKEADWAQIPVPLQRLLQKTNVNGPLVHTKLEERSASQMHTYLNVVFLRLQPRHVSNVRTEHEADLRALKRAQEFAEDWTRKAFPRTNL